MSICRMQFIKSFRALQKSLYGNMSFRHLNALWIQSQELFSGITSMKALCKELSGLRFKKQISPKRELFIPFVIHLQHIFWNPVMIFAQFRNYLAILMSVLL